MEKLQAEKKGGEERKLGIRDKWDGDCEEEDETNLQQWINI